MTGTDVAILTLAALALGAVTGYAIGWHTTPPPRHAPPPPPQDGRE